MINQKTVLLAVCIGLSVLALVSCGLTRPRPKVLDSHTAELVTDRGNSPETVTAYFLASLITKNGNWKNAVSDFPGAAEQVGVSVEEHWLKFTLIQAEIVRSEMTGSEQCRVKVKLTLSYNGETRTGTDDFNLIKWNNRWGILGLPL